MFGKRDASADTTTGDRSDVRPLTCSLPRRRQRDGESVELEPSSTGTSWGLLRVKLDFLTFFVSAFATYRVTILISRDLGPWRIFARLRDKSKLLKCPYCTSVYVGSLVTVGLWASGFVMQWPMWIILSFGLSASSIILDRCFSADYQP